MKCLDLFSGTRSIAKAFKLRGYETFTIELDRQHKNIVLFTFFCVFTTFDAIFDCITHASYMVFHYRCSI